jgi:hypothetical protein
LAGLCNLHGGWTRLALCPRAPPEPLRQPHLRPAGALAGGPPDNDTFFCEGTATWCFSINDTADSFDNHEAACKAANGHLVMYDIPGMQLLVEKVFNTLTDYWLGLKRASSSKPYVFTTGEARAAAAGCTGPLRGGPALQQHRL